jgi:tRNA threonylcarbamoyladenosine biosynthesis protein TsaB
MIVLGLDTALPACSAALVQDGAVLASMSEPMMRGHQERLAPMVAELMAGTPMSALGRIAVTVGPGSFTGLRVGLAFAKAMALALDRPCVGVGALHALAATARTQGMVAAAIDAKRGQVYLQIFTDGVAVSAPGAFDLAEAGARLADLAGGGGLTLIGSGAALLADVAPAATVIDAEAPDPVVVARLGAEASLVPPRPMYLRAPDARLPA